MEIGMFDPKIVVIKIGYQHFAMPSHHMAALAEAFAEAEEVYCEDYGKEQKFIKTGEHFDFGLELHSCRKLREKIKTMKEEEAATPETATEALGQIDSELDQEATAPESSPPDKLEPEETQL